MSIWISFAQVWQWSGESKNRNPNQPPFTIFAPFQWFYKLKVRFLKFIGCEKRKLKSVSSEKIAVQHELWGNNTPWGGGVTIICGLNSYVLWDRMWFLREGLMQSLKRICVILRYGFEFYYLKLQCVNVWILWTFYAAEKK